MEFETALETQRLKLLRLLAGWLAAVAFLAALPFSPALSRWVGGVVLSVLARAEAAAQYLVIAQARLIAAQTGRAVDSERFSDFRIPSGADRASAGSLTDLRLRLEALRVLLEDLPRFALRLLRRAEKRAGRLGGTRLTAPRPVTGDPEALCPWRLARLRIERPPDKTSFESRRFAPPQDESGAGSAHVTTSPRSRAGGEGGWRAAFTRDLFLIR